MSEFRHRFLVANIICGFSMQVMIVADAIASGGVLDNVTDSSCGWINSVYEDKGVVTSSFYEDKPTLSPKAGDAASMVMYLFRQSRSINRARLFFDDSQGVIFVKDAEDTDTGIYLLRQNATCKRGELFMVSERELYSEGLSFHELSRMNLRQTADGNLEVQWEIEQLSRPLFIFRQHFKMHGVVVFKPEAR